MTVVAVELDFAVAASVGETRIAEVFICEFDLDFIRRGNPNRRKALVTLSQKSDGVGLHLSAVIRFNDRVS